jgi:tetratricopeptide (TPR) repeat protein
MKRAAAGLLVLTLTLVASILAYLSVDREREYRELIAEGETSLRDGQTSGAIEAYSGAIALRPDSMLAHLRRGETYRRRGDFDAAARDLRRAADLDPSATRPLDELAEVFYRRQWFSQAAETYEARLRLDDQSIDVYYKLALARLRSSNLPGAIEAVTRVLAQHDSDADAHYLLGLCLREQGRTAEAARAFERTVALAPGMIPAREELSDAYATLGRGADQIEQLQAMAALDRTRIERQLAVSLAHARAGHGELAVLTLGNAIERTPNQPILYGALGRVWLDMADTRADALSKALEALERAAASDSATSEVLTLYGRALLKTDQALAAERVLQRATRNFPVDPAAFLEYAEAAERENHLGAARQALVDYGALVVRAPDEPSRDARVGRLSLRLNEPRVAVVWLRRAANARPADLNLLAALADAQLKAGDHAGAQASIQQALDREPDNPTFLALARRSR